MDGAEDEDDDEIGVASASKIDAKLKHGPGDDAVCFASDLQTYA